MKNDGAENGRAMQHNMLSQKFIDTWNIFRTGPPFCESRIFTLTVPKPDGKLVK